MRVGPVLVFAFVAAACGGAEASIAPATTVEPIEPLPPVTAIAAAPPAATTSEQSLVNELASRDRPNSNLAASETTTTLPPTNSLQLDKVATIHGDIAPKSVIASASGLVFAQNMMYRHTVTVYDESYELVATIGDSVNLSEFGFAPDDGDYQGAPVEAASTTDGSHVYVSNYRMYGPGYGNPGGDDCDLAAWDESFVYRIDTETLAIDQVIAVGAVPKFLATTPDDRLLLVSNWCSFDMSVIDLELGTEVARVPLGRHPRGIAVTQDSTTAYVAVMGSHNVAVVDLDTFDVDSLRNIGANPRHVVLDPTDQRLYVTLNGEGTVVAVDLATGTVTSRVTTGSAPRSMTISDDGQSLYVVNYESNTVSKVETTSMNVIQTVPVPERPIGITFAADTREVWVASYTGSITVLRESEAEG